MSTEAKWANGGSVLPQARPALSIEWAWANGESGDIGAGEYVSTATLPVLLTPLDLATNVGAMLPVHFSWQGVDYTAPYTPTYNLQVDDNSNFSSPEVDVETADTTYDTDSIKGGTKYYWRVRALR